MKTKILVAQSIPLSRVADLLASAWTGSSYWASIGEYKEPTAWEYQSFPVSDTGKRYGTDYPLNPGGAVIIEDNEEEKEHRLDLAKIESGLRIMSEKFPSHFGDFMSENEDNTTGDVFLQCCLFDDVIYG